MLLRFIISYLVTGICLYGQTLQLEAVDTFEIPLRENHFFAHDFSEGLVFYEPNQGTAYLFRYSTKNLEKYSLFVKKNKRQGKNAYSISYRGKGTIQHLFYFKSAEAFIFSFKSKYFLHNLNTKQNTTIASQHAWGHFSIHDTVVKLWDWSGSKIYSFTISKEGKIVQHKKYVFSLPIPPKALITTWYPCYHFSELNDSILSMTYTFAPTIFLYHLKKQCWVNTISIPIAQVQNDSLTPFGLTWYYTNPYKNFSFHTYHRFQYWTPKPISPQNRLFFQEVSCPLTHNNVYSLLENGTFPETTFRFILYDAKLNPIFISDEEKHRFLPLSNGMLGKIYFSTSFQKYILVRFKILET